MTFKSVIDLEYHEGNNKFNTYKEDSGQTWMQKLCDAVHVPQKLINLLSDYFIMPEKRKYIEYRKLGCQF